LGSLAVMKMPPIRWLFAFGPPMLDEACKDSASDVPEK
jgi:hypothetical protein